ncbi:MAG: class I SAM-dependent methyltransferase [Chloroflexota bacterium]
MTERPDTTFAGSIPEIYEQFAVPVVFQPYANDLVSRVAHRRLTSVLEIAAGTGVLTRALACALPDSVDIVATDLNQPMLDQAASRPIARPVVWQQADAMALPYQDDRFDAVLCQFGVMFFPNRAGGFAEARRVLSPDGVFAFNAWDRVEENDLAAAVTAALADIFPTDPPQFMARTPHGYADTARIGRDLQSAGFQNPPQVTTVTLRGRAETAQQAAIAYCQGTPFRAEIEARDPGGLERVTEAVAAAISDQFGSVNLDTKLQAHVILVEK